MATLKPRIQVTVTESQYQLLRRLAKLQSRPMGQLLSELVDQMEPVYERVAVVLQAAVRAQDSMREGLRTATESAEAELSPLLAKAMGQMDLLVAAAEAEPAIAPQSVASGAPPPSTPSPVTRGSDLPQPTPKARTSGPSGPRGRRQKPRKTEPLAHTIGRLNKRLDARDAKTVANAIAKAVKRGPVKLKGRRR